MADSSATGLILAPATRDNLVATIRRVVPFDTLEGVVSAELLAKLRQSSGVPGGAHFWAVIRGKRTLWESLVRQDIVLFLETGSQYASDSARPVGRIESRRLGDRLWRIVPGDPWELVFVVDHVRRHRIPKSHLLEELGYNRAFRVPGTIRVSDDRLQRVRTSWGSLERMLEGISD